MNSELSIGGLKDTSEVWGVSIKEIKYGVLLFL